MSFLSLGELKLELGDETIQQFVNGILEEAGVPRNVKIVLKKFLEGEFTPDKIEGTLVNAIKEYAGTKSDKLIPLFEKLDTVSSKKEQSDRQVGWPTIEFSRSAKKANPKKGYEFGIDVNAKGGAVFEVDGDDNRKTMVKFSGKADLAGSGNLKFDQGSVGTSANAQANRHLQYDFKNTSNQYVGLALASALSGLALPSNALAIHKGFTTTDKARLQQIVLKGGRSLGGKANIAAKFPTQYGIPGIELSGHLNLGRNFECTITPGRNSKAGIRLTYKGGKETARGYDAALTYTVGLSTILPTQARELLKFSTKLHEAIVKIDTYAEEKIPDSIEDYVSTVLKPGSWVKDEISEKVGEVINKLKGTNNGDLTVLAGIARLLGVDDFEKSNLTVADLKAAATGQISEIIAEILDGRLDAYDLSASKLASVLVNNFQNALPASVLSDLDKEVFTTISEKLESKLKKLQSRIDVEVSQELKELDVKLNTDGKIVKLKSFIKKARGIAKKVLGQVTKAQTEILAAELGYENARTKGESLSYVAEFDTTKLDATNIYRTAILHPAKFINEAFSDSVTDGVDVENYEVMSRISKKSGPRWSVVFLDIPLGYKSLEISDVDVVASTDGAKIIRKSEVTKKGAFWDEVRYFSFVTASNVVQSRLENVGPNSTADVGSSAEINLNLREDDGATNYKEVMRNINRFSEFGVIKDDVGKTIVEDVKSALKSKSKKGTSINIKLGVPSDVVVSIYDDLASQNINKRVQAERELLNMSARSVAAVEAALTRKVGLKLADTDSREVLGLKEFNDAEIGELGLDKRTDVVLRLVNLFENGELDQAVAGARSKGAERISRSRRAREAARESADAKKLYKAAKAVSEIMQIASELYFRTDIPTPAKNANTYKADLKKFTSDLERKQSDINKIAKRFLNPGTPLPKALRFFGGTFFKSNVILFKTLQDYVGSRTGVYPPLVISMTYADGDSETYIAPYWNS